MVKKNRQTKRWVRILCLFLVFLMVLSVTGALLQTLFW